ncbi:MAG TPA: GntR family transcriptional regulator [Thermoguttaceae bacterium]|nr:GntR family transcriptional regulator [Thermoguttaceae bacterium]
MPEKLADKAYDHIRRWLLTGQLAPGTRLSNRVMAKRLDISFTPVREALTRLVSEGLLEFRAGVGVCVPVIDRHEIEDVYELRETLECAAIAKVVGKLPASVLDEMETLLDEMVRIGETIQKEHGGGHDEELTDRHGQIDAAFHQALLRAAGNRLALETVAGLRRVTAVIAHTFDVNPWQEIARTHNEHRGLLDALRRGDTADAQAVMATHIRNGCRLSLAAHQRHYMNQSTDAPRGRGQEAGVILSVDK